LYYIRKKSAKVRRATEIAAKYQQREGRHKIRVKVLMTPFAGDMFHSCLTSCVMSVGRMWDAAYVHFEKCLLKNY